MTYVSFEVCCIYWAVVSILIVYVGYTMYRDKDVPFERDVDL